MKNKLCDIHNILEIKRRFNFRASKCLGQNFLINREIAFKISANSGVNKNTGVLEIGPGIGSLTFELALISKKVVCIEIDKKLINVLKHTLKDFNNIKVINADILKLDLAKIIKEEFSNMQVVVCANIPYYITSNIIMRFLEEKINIKSLTFMLQKEVAQRLIALPGSPGCGSISVSIRYFSIPELLFNVSRENFMPVPKVDSSVIKFKIKKEPNLEIKNKELFFKIVKAVFSEKRKAIKNPLHTRTNFSKQDVLLALEGAKISPLLRAEHLNMEKFVRLSNVMSKLGK
ncbi:MAG: 16S rRNA (adenine(1518)-N(6)/adenine(1519)-N(6))-dimethyltransferase RsmA [Oscillospiraceae bacterium]|nr:16S rRNA (adenine(1518)-N(6)/adenine(1519)-N(6))-dimethyltransferase RsmA [Oscillospiraceae bacterium]